MALNANKLYVCVLIDFHGEDRSPLPQQSDLMSKAS